jgi:type I site-specific restriction endonuclease
MNLSNTGDEDSANTLENTEVNQDMLEDEFSDSNIAEIEMLLQDTTHTLPSDYQNPKKAHTERNTLATTSAIKKEVKPKRHQLGNLPERILSKALQKANIAVLRDNNHDYSSAIDSYTEACDLLRQVIDSPTVSGEEQRQLETIRNDYYSRMAVLMGEEQNESPIRGSYP